MLSLHAAMLVSPNATNEAAQSLYEYWFNSQLKLPEILSCQAEARRLALTTLIVRFRDFLVHKSLFTKGFWLAAAEIIYDGATTETANVVSVLAIQKLDSLKVWCPRRWTKPNAMCNVIEVICPDAVERAHTKSLDANDKLRQTRPHVRNTIVSRKRQVIMRKVKFTM